MYAWRWRWRFSPRACRWRLRGWENAQGRIALAAGQVGIPLLTLMLAGLVGMEFPLAAKIDFRTSGGDGRPALHGRLRRRRVGALLVSTLLIPILGGIWGMYFDRRLESVGRRHHARR